MVTPFRACVAVIGVAVAALGIGACVVNEPTDSCDDGDCAPVTCTQMESVVLAYNLGSPYGYSVSPKQYENAVRFLEKNCQPEMDCGRAAQVLILVEGPEISRETTAPGEYERALAYMRTHRCPNFEATPSATPPLNR